MPERDTILTVLSTGIALAGLLLIFSGFLISKAASYETRRGEKYRNLARLTIIPVIIAIGESWISIMALEGNQTAGTHLILGLKITLAFTTIFSIIGILVAA